eukprot:s2802_g5.t1
MCGEPQLLFPPNDPQTPVIYFDQPSRLRSPRLKMNGWVWVATHRCVAQEMYPQDSMGHIDRIDSQWASCEPTCTKESCSTFAKNSSYPTGGAHFCHRLPSASVR